MQIQSKFLIVFLATLFLTSSSFGQVTSFIPNEILVQVKKDASIYEVVSDFDYFGGQATNVRVSRQISRPADIWLLEFKNHSSISHLKLVEAFHNHPVVIAAQVNHILQERATPNDPDFGLQWQYINSGTGGGLPNADLDADLAWNFTTGGLTSLGDTIVVAVVDDGLDITHPDFDGNIWVNHHEIPGNNIDDDLNGYVDDYNGWNVPNNNDDISGGGHGTPVAGIVGARGDNGIGVTGVNWVVKLMIIRRGLANEADAIAGYSYALENRMLYNSTNGAKGAFVVVANSSWGVNFGQPSSAPLWCSFYDTLGVHGILSVAATSNDNQDVDAVGDLPTSCVSDYLLTVTNVDFTDTKVTNAGFGLTTIDLGAYGQGTYTTSFGGYGTFGGTSGAAPHVTGVAALMYAANCNYLSALAKADPGGATLLVKQSILDGTVPISSLAGASVSGGRLNALNSILELINNCGSGTCFPPYGIHNFNTTDVQTDIGWLSIDANSYEVQYGPFAGSSWTSITSVDDTITLSGLVPCTTYEVKIGAVCDTSSSALSASYFFTTDGCCTPPVGLTVSTVEDSTVNINWTPLFAAVEYEISYHPVGGAWTIVSGISEVDTTLDLASCQEYEFVIQALCSNGSFTGFSDTISFTTNGCGSCLDKEYCQSMGESTQYEWIERVKVGTYENISGANSGYLEVVNSGIELEAGSTYTLEVSPGFSGVSYNEVFRVWIDYNQSGVFWNQELIFAPLPTSSTLSTTFTVPSTALNGSTRMRVSMSYSQGADACQTFANGEVEDYCITISGATNIELPDSGALFNVFPNPFLNTLNVLFDASYADEIEIVSVDGRVLKTIYSNAESGNETISIELSDLPAGIYLVGLKGGEGRIYKKVVKN